MDNTQTGKSQEALLHAVDGVPKMLSPTELIHFVAAQELAEKGMLAADTVELLVFFAPRPLTTIRPISDKQGETLMLANITGVGRSWTVERYVNTDENAKSLGKKGETILEGGISAMAQMAKAHLINFQRQIVTGLRRRVVEAVKNGTAVKKES